MKTSNAFKNTLTDAQWTNKNAQGALVDRTGVKEQIADYGLECALKDAMVEDVKHDGDAFRLMMTAETGTTGNGVDFANLTAFNKKTYCTDVIAMIKDRNTKCAKTAATFSTWECKEFDNIRKARMVKAKKVASTSWLELGKDVVGVAEVRDSNNNITTAAVTAVTKKATALSAMNLDKTTLEGALRAIATEEANSKSEDSTIDGKLTSDRDKKLLTKRAEFEKAWMKDAGYDTLANDKKLVYLKWLVAQKKEQNKVCAADVTSSACRFFYQITDTISKGFKKDSYWAAADEAARKKIADKAEYKRTTISNPLLQKALFGKVPVKGGVNFSCKNTAAEGEEAKREKCDAELCCGGAYNYKEDAAEADKKNILEICLAKDATSYAYKKDLVTEVETLKFKCIDGATTMIASVGAIATAYMLI